MTRRSLALVALLAVAFAPAARAGTTVPVNLKAAMGPQITAEKSFKKLIDEWADPGLDINFKARPEYSLDHPTTVRVYLENVKAAVNAGWWARYRGFHQQLVGQPFAAEVFRHAASYCRGGAVFMQAACLDASGKVIYRGEVHNMPSMSRAEDTQLYFFVDHTRGALPAAPPPLDYLVHGTVGDPIFVDLPTSLAATVTRIRLVDRPAARWPVPLDPTTPTPKPS